MCGGRPFLRIGRNLPRNARAAADHLVASMMMGQEVIGRVVGLSAIRGIDDCRLSCRWSFDNSEMVMI